MTESQTRRTRSGRILTHEEIEKLATEVAETDYDVPLVASVDPTSMT